MKYPLIAARLINTPLLVTQDALAAIHSGIGERLDIQFVGATPQAAASSGQPATDGGLWISGGVAVIDIMGPLVHRASAMDAMCGGPTTYDALSHQLAAAVASPDVRSILLNIASPGGEAGGVNDLAAEITAARAIKPVVAVAADMAASAAYWLASAATEIVVTATGSVGSIGVVWTHADWSQANAKQGIAVTHVFAGARKIDGTPHAPLSQEALAVVQDRIGTLYERFTASVASNRGLDQQAVKATEAAMFMGHQAVAVGLADRVGTFKETLLRLQADSSGAMTRHHIVTGGSMSIPTPGGAQPTPQQPVPASPAADATALTQARADGYADGVKDERARVSAILGDAEADGRTALAQHIAFNTDMAPDAANGLLKVSPKAVAETAKDAAQATPFERAMATVGNPPIGADAPPAGTGEDAATQALLATAKAHGLLAR